MKKLAVSTLFTGLLNRMHRTLFRHMVKSGLVLCAVPPADGEQGDNASGDTTAAATDDQGKSETLDQGNTEGDQEGQADDEQEVVVTIGEEAPPSDEEESRAPDWVRELRKSDREKAKKIREQDAEIARLKGQTAAPQAIVVGDKPTLEGCEYDSDEFERKLEAWHDRKRQAAEETRKRDSERQAADDAWQAKLSAHSKAKAALKVPDYEDAEAVISDLFSQTQRGIIVSGAENSAVVEYALGKNPAKAKELAAITDPVKFCFAVARLESQLKVTPRKAPPPPEKTIRGSAAVAGSTDKELVRLEAEAERTGDRSKVIAYNRSQRRVAA